VKFKPKKGLITVSFSGKSKIEYIILKEITEFEQSLGYNNVKDMTIMSAVKNKRNYSIILEL